MPQELIDQLASLGISGLFFVMWWFERAERSRLSASNAAATQRSDRQAELNDQILNVIRENADAAAALREELRAGFQVQRELLERISRQLDVERMPLWRAPPAV